MKKRKLPPYVDLAIIKLKNGNFEDVDSITEILINNITKDRSDKKGKVLKWAKSITEYWMRVFVVWMDCMKEALSKDRSQWKIYYNYVESRLRGHGKGKS